VPGGDCSGLRAAAARAEAMFGWTGKDAADAGAAVPSNKADTASTTPAALIPNRDDRRIRNEASSTLRWATRRLLARSSAVDYTGVTAREPILSIVRKGDSGEQRLR